MIKIVNKLGDNELTVTKGAYEDLYKHLGYKLIEENEVKEEIEEIKEVEENTSLASDSIDEDKKEETVKSEETFKSTKKKR